MVVGGNLYLCGGFDGYKLNDIWKINANELCFRHWRKPSIIKIKDTEIEDLEKYFSTLKSETWKVLGFAKQDYIPVERTGHCFEYYNYKLYCLGGIMSNNEYILYNFADVFSLEKMKWEVVKLEGPAPSPRSGMRGVPIGSELGSYLFIGGYHLNEYFNAFHILDLAQMQWRPGYSLGENIPCMTDFSLCEGKNSTQFIYGGRSASSIYGELYQLSPINLSDYYKITKLSPIGKKPCKRFGHTSCRIDSSM